MLTSIIFIFSINLKSSFISKAINSIYTTKEFNLLIQKDISELKVDAVPAVEEATVAIAGNKNIKEGENLITIVVYNEKNEVVVYLNGELLNKKFAVLYFIKVQFRLYFPCDFVVH